VLAVRRIHSPLRRTSTADDKLSGTTGSVPLSARGSASVSAPLFARSSTPATILSPRGVTVGASVRTSSCGRAALYPAPCDSPAVGSAAQVRVASLTALPFCASPPASQMMPPLMGAVALRSGSETPLLEPLLSTQSYMTEAPHLQERKTLIWPQMEQIDGGLQTSLAEQAKYEAAQVQILTETLKANLQSHAQYCESQFQILFDNAQALCTSMEQNFKRINMPRLQQMQDINEQRLLNVENAIANMQSLSVTSEARFHKMTKESDAVDKEIRALAAEWEEVSKVSVSGWDMDESLKQLADRVDKLEGAQVQSGSPTPPAVSAEDIAEIRNTMAELSDQIQSGIGERRAYVAHIQDLALRPPSRGSLHSQSRGSFDGIEDAPGHDFTPNTPGRSPKELTFEGAALLDASHNFTDVDQRLSCGLKSAIALRVKSLNAQQKFSAAAGALRVSSLVAGLGGERGCERVELSEPAPVLDSSFLAETPDLTSPGSSL